MKFKYWKLWKLTNAQRAMSKNHLQKIHTHFESNFWEAWTRIASSLSRVWASPAFTVIFLSKNNLDLFKAEKFYDHRRPLMFNVFTFKLHIVTQSHSIHLWDHISPYKLFKLNQIHKYIHTKRILTHGVTDWETGTLTKLARHRPNCTACSPSKGGCFASGTSNSLTACQEWCCIDVKFVPCLMRRSSLVWWFGDTLEAFESFSPVGGPSRVLSVNTHLVESDLGSCASTVSLQNPQFMIRIVCLHFVALQSSS